MAYKIAFMGTPAFAVPSLAGLLSAGYPVPAVITRPDRPAGRGKKLQISAVKRFALKHDLTVKQPSEIKNGELVKILRDKGINCVVVVAYGRIIPLEVLAEYGCVNLHASLLPKYRGASPINWAIVCGERETGVTTMMISPQMDTGDILLQEKLKIGATETAGSLHDRLAPLGARLLVKTLRGMEGGTVRPVPQDGSRATYCPLLKKSDGMIDWEKPAIEINNLIRGLFPWPGTYTFHRGRRLVITSAQAVKRPADADRHPPGQLIRDCSAQALYAVTGDGWLLIERVKPENRKEMSAQQFVSGVHNTLGMLTSIV